MKEVLILGNGISRLLHEELIEQWTGELWATNYAYLEYGHRISMITGHTDVLIKAMEFRDEGQHSFTILTGNLGKIPEGDNIEKVACPPHFWKDSGSTLISEALERDYDKILLCGFDHGGRDIYSLALHTQNKTNWVRRMREMRKHYGDKWDAIEYVGYDHMPYILSGDDPGRYARRYLQGMPHIPDPDYIALSQLLYGSESIYGRRSFMRLRVRYLKGAKPGFETVYNEDLAKILFDRGEIEVLGPVEEERPEEPEVTADTKLTARMSKPTLVKIATMKGIEDADDYTVAELRELIAEDVSYGEDDGEDDGEDKDE